jgi:hypothetical protein
MDSGPEPERHGNHHQQSRGHSTPLTAVLAHVGVLAKFPTYRVVNKRYIWRTRAQQTYEAVYFTRKRGRTELHHGFSLQSTLSTILKP